MTIGGRYPTHRRDDAPRRRLLMVAFGCHPTESMEWRIGWRRALLAAESCDVTVLHGPAIDSRDLTRQAIEERGTDRGVEFIQVERGALGDWFHRFESTFYLGYGRWNHKALQTARRLHAEKPFDLTHQVNYCGFREPGLLWKLGLPFVWGPVGGTQSLPRRFLGVLTPVSGAREVVRSMLNWCQLRFSPKVRGAVAAADVLLAATRTAQSDLRRGLSVNSVRQLETGLDCEIGPERRPRDASRPFRILWAGRLRAWKAFPLLLRALEQLPDAIRVEVRVLGTGNCREAWQREAKRRGVAEKIEWIEWPGYEATLPHYRWADAFAFTSLRDTSGTGLIEALAAGAPVIGLDHQGAADILTAECSERIAVTTPRRAAADMAAAIERLSADPRRLHELSLGAQRRAADYQWEARSEFTRLLYDGVMSRKANRSAREAADIRIGPAAQAREPASALSASVSSPAGG